MKRIFTLLSILLMSFALSNSYAGNNFRVGVVDSQKLQTAMRDIWNTQIAPSEDFKKEQEKVAQLRLELQKKHNILNDEDNPVSKTVVEKVQKEINDLQAELTKYQGTLRERMMSARTKQAEKVRDDMKNEIAKVAKQHRVNLVMVSHQVLFSDNEVDITEDVIKALTKKKS